VVERLAGSNVLPSPRKTYRRYRLPEWIHFDVVGGLLHRTEKNIHTIAQTPAPTSIPALTPTPTPTPATTQVLNNRDLLIYQVASVTSTRLVTS
jgi:hypothetical protein